MVGCETALWLKNMGKEVTIIELMDDILTVGGPLCHANHDMLKDLVTFKKINVKCKSKIIKAVDSRFVVQTGDAVEEIKADSAIVANGYNSENSLAKVLKFNAKDLRIIGDVSKVKNIMYAIWDAYEVAKNIKKKDRMIIKKEVRFSYLFFILGKL